MRSDMVPGGTFPDFRTARSHKHTAQAQRVTGVMTR